jgi:hypothetical protein
MVRFIVRLLLGAIGVSVIGLAAFRPGAAEEAVPMKTIADLVLHKGWKANLRPELCVVLQLRGNPSCANVGIETDEDEAKEWGWAKDFSTSFEVFVEQRTGEIKVGLFWTPKPVSYGFMTDANGNLQTVVSGRYSPNNKSSQWSVVDSTSELETIFAKTKSIWLSQKMLKALEAAH